MAQKEEIESKCKDNYNLNRKKLKTGKYEKIETCLYDWFLEM